MYSWQGHRSQTRVQVARYSLVAKLLVLETPTTDLATWTARFREKLPHQIRSGKHRNWFFSRRGITVLLSSAVRRERPM